MPADDVDLIFNASTIAEVSVPIVCNKESGPVTLLAQGLALEEIDIEVKWGTDDAEFTALVDDAEAVIKMTSTIKKVVLRDPMIVRLSKPITGATTVSKFS